MRVDGMPSRAAVWVDAELAEHHDRVVDLVSVAHPHELANALANCAVVSVQLAEQLVSLGEPPEGFAN